MAEVAGSNPAEPIVLFAIRYARAVYCRFLRYEDPSAILTEPLLKAATIMLRVAVYLRGSRYSLCATKASEVNDAG